MSDRAQLNGLILAGGRSQRMGRDKASLRLDGVTLLERAAAVLGEAVATVYVSARPGQQDISELADIAVIKDRQANIGPAAGILAAHQSAPDAAWLVVACDMPLLNQAALQLLVSERDPRRAATVMAADGAKNLEPLCAIYEPGTLAAFLSHVADGGDSSPRNWLRQVDVKVVAGPSAETLRSANTPAEWEEIVNLHESRETADRNQ